jgi:transposase-like protein
MKGTENQYIKRTQRDYSMSFKLRIVAEIERGEISEVEAKKKYGIQSKATIRNWVKKFGNFDRTYELEKRKMKSPEQKLLESEQRIKLLEQRNKSLERDLGDMKKKAAFFDMMIDIAEEELKISIRKKSLSDPSTHSEKSIKKT